MRRRNPNVRYAYAITAALLLGGAASRSRTSPSARRSRRTRRARSPRRRARRADELRRLVARLQPAVVNISTKQRGPGPHPGQSVRGVLPPLRRPERATPRSPGGGGGASRSPARRSRSARASSFRPTAISSPTTIVITGAGGAARRSTAITVTLPDRKEYVARMIGRDTASDLALLKIEATNLPFVKFGDSTTRAGRRLGDRDRQSVRPRRHRHRGHRLGAAPRSPAGGAYDRYIQTDAVDQQGQFGRADVRPATATSSASTRRSSRRPAAIVGIGFAIPAERPSRSSTR